MDVKLTVYKNELSAELDNILKYWQKYAVDKSNGGFFGKIDNDNKITDAAPKGVVLNSRILWTFAAAYNHIHREDLLLTAKKAYDYINAHFKDKEFGGVFWSVDHKGNPLNTRKQIYGLAFTIYGLSEYYLACQDPEALAFARELYYVIEKYSYDKVKGGYYEAFASNWKTLDDLRLSDKDANEKKTMNTHLHILEAYTTLYRAWPDPELKRRIHDLVKVFISHIINPATYHLNLFMDENWVAKSYLVSFGHDIEASWLLLEAAEAIHDHSLTAIFKNASVKMAIAAAQGIEPSGGLIYERDNSHKISEKHWWVQAEAMIGFFNAWQISNDESFLDYSIHTWSFIKNNIIDRQNGEWFWGIGEDGKIMPDEDKIGFWKCPYHNARACMEIIKRIESA